MKIKPIAKKVELNLRTEPKNIFLIDGIGALVTFLFLFGIGFLVQEYFGIPKNVLYILAFVALFYAIYSFLCYFFLFDNFGKSLRKWQFFLKIIIIANSLYCMIIAFLLVLFYQNLTVLGLSYFILEIGVIIILVILETRIAFR